MLKKGLILPYDSDEEKSSQQTKSNPLNNNKVAFDKDVDNLLFKVTIRKNSYQSIKKDNASNNSQFSRKSTVVDNPILSDKSISSKRISRPCHDHQDKQQSSVIQIKQVKKQIDNRNISINKNRYKSSISTAPINITQTQAQIIQAKIQQKFQLKKNEKTRHVSLIDAKNIELPKNVETKESISYSEYQKTRPAYIRKFKQIAQCVQFKQQNLNHHKFINIHLPSQCLVPSLTKSTFIDLNFLLTQTQITDSSIIKKYNEFVNHTILGKYIDPNDIKKGILSSQKFLSVMAVLAEREDNIKRLIEQQIVNTFGFYYVRLFVNATWRYYSLDPYILVNTNNLIPNHHHHNAMAMSYNDMESDLWVMLVQKAYAKAYHGYQVFKHKKTSFQTYLRDLTGAPITTYEIESSEFDDLKDIIKKAVLDKKVIGIVPKYNIGEIGLNPECLLSVINISKKGGLTLRYSWPLIKQKALVGLSRQGIYQVSYQEILTYFQRIIISNINREFFSTTVQIQHQPYSYTCYILNLAQSTNGTLTLSQIDQRLFVQSQNYQYLQMRIIVQKKVGDGYQFVKGVWGLAQRNLDLKLGLVKGQYRVFAFLYNKQHVNRHFFITFYGDAKVDFIKVPVINDPNIISYGLQNWNIKNGKRSVLGHVHQYISYHSQTNLMLITAVNTSNKPYKFFQDLSKINFITLQLINLPHNKHNELQKLRSCQIFGLIKQRNENRKWQIELNGQQMFTWVLSTSEKYDSVNFRNWGFR